MCILQEFLNDSRDYILEASLYDWTDERRFPQSGISDYRRIASGGGILQNKSNFDILSGILYTQVKSAKEIPGGVRWGKGYKPKVIPTRGMESDMANYSQFQTYETAIQFVDWENIFKEYIRAYKSQRGEVVKKLKGLTKKDIMQRILYETDVRFDCNCPSFYWQGFKYALQTIGSALDTSPVPPSKVWLDKHRREGGAKPPYIVCKHIRAVLRDLRNPQGYLMGVIYRKLSNDVIFNDLMKQMFSGEDDRVTWY